MTRGRFASKEEIEDLLDKGFDAMDIAAEYHVSRQTVYNAIHAYRLDHYIEDRIPTHVEFGWQIRAEHVQDYHLRMLRTAYRKHRGRKPVNLEWERQADSWLEQRRREGVVVTYHPGRGFGLSPRRDGDEWMWRPGHWAYPVRKPPRKERSGRRGGRSAGGSDGE